MYINLAETDTKIRNLKSLYMKVLKLNAINYLLPNQFNLHCKRQLKKLFL